MPSADHANRKANNTRKRVARTASTTGTMSATIRAATSNANLHQHISARRPRPNPQSPRVPSARVPPDISQRQPLHQLDHASMIPASVDPPIQLQPLVLSGRFPLTSFRPPSTTGQSPCLVPTARTPRCRDRQSLRQRRHAPPQRTSIRVPVDPAIPCGPEWDRQDMTNHQTRPT
jgi:hypothetical protein